MTVKQQDKKIKEIKRFQVRALKVHGTKFNYDYLPTYLPEDKAITLRCPEHGKFTTTTISHVSSKHGGCHQCRVDSFRKARSTSKDSFIEKSSAVHENKYDYSKVEYINSKLPVVISCPEHGDFEQAPRNHTDGRGCPQCSADRNRPSVWDYTGWEEAGNTSKQFDGYKLYIIFCTDYNTGEKFIKIGKTFAKVSSRFSGKAMPYDYIVLYEYVGSAGVVSKFEAQLHNYFKEQRHTPTIEFGGQTECFKPDIPLVEGIPDVMSDLFNMKITYEIPPEYT